MDIWIMQPYRYHALLENQIRLLRLCARNDDADPITCHLITVNFGKHDDIPQYETLSYVWGTEPADRLVFIGETISILRVKPNLEDALTALSRPSIRYDEKPNIFSDRLLWIDAICIDQENIQERNHQVSIMGRIYARSS